MVKRPGGTKRAKRGASPDGRSSPEARSEEWPRDWKKFVEAFGGPVPTADELGIHYQTLWRWGIRGDDPPEMARKFIRMLAAQKGVSSPV